MPRSVLLLWLMGGFFLKAADCVGASADTRPVLLMVDVAVTPEDQAVESRFHDELRIQLDRFAVVRIPPVPSEFVRLALAQQIEALRPVLGTSGAVAAMWLSRVTPDVLLLQVVVLSTGKALVRVFEQDLLRGTEAELAGTAAELLGTAFMFELEQNNRAIARVVDDTRQRVLAVEARQHRWKFTLGLSLRQGIAGQRGAASHGGLSLGAEYRATQRLHFGPAIGAGFGPLGTVRGYSIAGWNVWAEWGGFVGFPLGRTALGPMFGIRAGSSSLNVVREGFDNREFQKWFLSGMLGAGLRIPASDKVAVHLSTGLEGTPGRIEVRSLADDRLISASAVLAWWFGAGLVLF